jgi:hypothetical protein
MRVGKAGMAPPCQLPELRRPADTARDRLRLDQRVGGELHQLLAGILTRRAQRLAEIARRLRASRLQQKQQPVRHRSRRRGQILQVVV